MTRGRKKDEFDPCLIVATLRITPILSVPPLPPSVRPSPVRFAVSRLSPVALPRAPACVVAAALPSLRAALYSTLAST